MATDNGPQQSSSAAPAPTISLATKVAFLSSPAAYHAAGLVDSIETHMSWVFLVGEFAFKLKKPVHFSYLDFSTLEARETNCRMELTLNKRLAPDVYLRVVPLTLIPGIGLMIEGAGEVVDWLVVMRRLPADRMLEALIARRALEPAHAERLAATLARFYNLAKPVKVSPFEYFRRLDAEQAENRKVLTLSRFPIRDDALVILDRMDAALAGNRSHLQDRAAEGHLVDGHGDLRPDHICFEDGVVIFDCLEFNEVLRQVDPVDEVAGLKMECARLGIEWFGTQVLQRVISLTGSRREAGAVDRAGCVTERGRRAGQGCRGKPSVPLEAGFHSAALAARPETASVRESLVDGVDCGCRRWVHRRGRDRRLRGSARLDRTEDCRADVSADTAILQRERRAAAEGKPPAGGPE